MEKSWRTRVARTRARGKRITATWNAENSIGRTRVAQRTTQAPQRVKIPMFNAENLNKKKAIKIVNDR